MIQDAINLVKPNALPGPQQQQLQQAKWWFQVLSAYMHFKPGDEQPAPQSTAPAQAQSPNIETQIKDLRAQIVEKWNQMPANFKTEIKARPDLKNYETAFNQAPKGTAAKLQALQKVFDYLDSQSKPEGELDLTAPTPTPAAQQHEQKTSTELNTDIMGKGYNQGKAYAPGSQLSPGEIPTIAATQAQAARYTTTGNAQDSFIEGWIDGYYDGHNVPGDPERGSAQTVQPTPTPSPAARPSGGPQVAKTVDISNIPVPNIPSNRGSGYDVSPLKEEVPPPGEAAKQAVYKIGTVMVRGILLMSTLGVFKMQPFGTHLPSVKVL
jgi:hypothetical protein